MSLPFLGRRSWPQEITKCFMQIFLVTCLMWDSKDEFSREMALLEISADFYQFQKDQSDFF